MCLRPVWRRLSKGEEAAGKRILIVGGSSGLGLALAVELKRRKADVTITSRSNTALGKLQSRHGFKALAVDVTCAKSVAGLPFDFDWIFSCAGFSRPCALLDVAIESLKSTMETNFYGAVLLYMHFMKEVSPERRRKFVFVSSTLGLHSFTGYATYSPSKCALRSFFESVRVEARMHGMDTYIYYVSTINSPGLEKEDESKPEATKMIEGSSRGEASDPRRRALALLRGMEHSDVIVSDFTTRLFLHSTDILSLADLFAWIIAPFFWILFKIFAEYQTRRYSKISAKQE